MKIWKGGLHLFGIFLFGFVAAKSYWNKELKKKLKKINLQISFDEVSDAVLTAAPLAQSIGRFANLVNLELFGPPTNQPWGIFIPPSKRPTKFAQFQYFHPAFLYESILNLINFLILHKLRNYSRFNHKKGTISGLYMINYGIIRLIVERFRIDTNPIFLFLKINDIFSLILISIGTFIIFSKNKKDKK